MRELQRRLELAPAIVQTVLRDHRYTITRDKSPAILIYEIFDKPVDAQVNPTCSQMRELAVTIGIVVRSDTARADTDALWIAVQERVAPAWDIGITVRDGKATWNDEIADLDICELQQEIFFRYASPRWDLTSNSYST